MKSWCGCSAFGLTGQGQSPPAMGLALLPVLSEISQWDPPSPTPTQDWGCWDMVSGRAQHRMGAELLGAWAYT